MMDSKRVILYFYIAFSLSTAYILVTLCLELLDYYIHDNDIGLVSGSAEMTILFLILGFVFLSIFTYRAVLLYWELRPIENNIDD